MRRHDESAIHDWSIAAIVALVSATASGQQYDTAALAKFRADRETSLKGDTGWLTVAGLHFLNPAPTASAPIRTTTSSWTFRAFRNFVGVITMNGTRSGSGPREGQTLTINDKPVTESELHGAFDDKPVDTLRFGPVTFFVHYSGPRLALRVRDQASALRTNFRGLQLVRSRSVVSRRRHLYAYPETEVVQIPNILGDLEPFAAVGTVTFSLDGASTRWKPGAVGKRLWFVFRDRTSGRDTYPSARFLYTDAPDDGKVVIDFNYAQNPPCAYNPYTTCPLPPAQNRLTLRLRRAKSAMGEEPRRFSSSRVRGFAGWFSGSGVGSAVPGGSAVTGSLAVAGSLAVCGVVVCGSTFCCPATAGTRAVGWWQ